MRYLIPLPGVILIKKGLRGGVGRVGWGEVSLLGAAEP